MSLPTERAFYCRQFSPSASRTRVHLRRVVHTCGQGKICGGHAQAPQRLNRVWTDPVGFQHPGQIRPQLRRPLLKTVGGQDGHRAGGQQLVRTDQTRIARRKRQKTLRGRPPNVISQPQDHTQNALSPVAPELHHRPQPVRGGIDARAFAELIRVAVMGRARLKTRDTLLLQAVQQGALFCQPLQEEPARHLPRQQFDLSRSPGRRKSCQLSLAQVSFGDGQRPGGHEHRSGGQGR